MLFAKTILNAPPARAGYNQKKNTAGFSLVELLIVIAVISILAGLTLAVVSSVRGKAVEVRAVQTIGEIDKALSIFKSTFGYLPNPDDIDEDVVPYKNFTDEEKLMAKDSMIAFYLCGGEIMPKKTNETEPELDDDGQLILKGMGKYWDKNRQVAKPAPLSYTKEDFYTYGDKNDIEKCFALLMDPWFIPGDAPTTDDYKKGKAPAHVFHYRTEFESDNDTDEDIDGSKLPKLPYYIYSTGDPINYPTNFSELSDNQQMEIRTDNLLGNWRKQP
ncbi:MAG: type II secretion system protein [Planctomycetes bacterium]|nr:type II secretion system protein [Planctomycetota bacterium]